MKLMKVIYTMRNMMVQEFQHFVEFQLIEVMILENADDSIRANRVFPGVRFGGRSAISYVSAF
jgi:hypothetical protein